MKINTKWVFFDFLPYQYKCLEEYLEDMASNGWKLKGTKGAFIKFEKVEHRKIKYLVDIMDKISFLDGKDSDAALKYREYYSVAGWDFVCEMDKIQIYCSENEIESIPILTDEKEKFNCIFKESFKYIILSLFMVILFIVIQYTTIIGRGDATFLASNSEVCLIVALSACIIYHFIGYINFSLWVINGKIRLKKKKVVIYNHFTGIKIRRSIRNIMLIVFISMILVMLIKTLSCSNIFSEGKTNISEYSLTLEDFNDEAENNEVPYINEDSSFLAHALLYIDIGEKFDLMYDLFESEYEWVINCNFNKQKIWYEERDIKNLDLPENIKVYKQLEGEYYIIKTSNKMIRILNADNKLSEYELLNTVYENVFK